MPGVSIGWIMFFKSLVAALFSSAVGAYKAYKAKRRAAGLVLKYNARRGVYYDPIMLFEKRIRVALWIVGVPLGLYTLFIYLLLIGPPLWARLAG